MLQSRINGIVIRHLPLPIEVTQEHISMGVPCDSSGCPIALAMGWNLGKFLSYRVTRNDIEKIMISAYTDASIYIRFKDTSGLFMRYSISKKASKFINKFDNQMNCYTMKPFSTKMRLTAITYYRDENDKKGRAIYRKGE